MVQQEGFMVFWMEQLDCMTPFAKHFEMNEMSAALAFMEVARGSGICQFVTMVSQNSNSVGRAGVAAVVAGKTPDGETYEWSKAGRAGKTKRSEQHLMVPKAE